MSDQQQQKQQRQQQQQGEHSDNDHAEERTNKRTYASFCSAS